MRNVAGNRNLHQFPLWLENKKADQLSIAKAQGKAEIEVEAYKGKKITITDPKDDYFGDEEFEIRYLLRKAFNNKCVYCEREEFKPDVDHFRPKGRITGKGGNKHGYYWLCYNWTNLLPSCADCNRFSGKLDKFPVEGTRITKPPYNSNGKLDYQACSVDSFNMISEQAYLLNPEIDQPEKHFKVEWNGKLSGIDIRGVKTIDICNLNRARKKIIERYVTNIYSFFFKFRDKTIDANALKCFLVEQKKDCKVLSDPKNEFSLVYFFILTHWNQFVDELFPKLDKLEKKLLKNLVV